MQEAINAKTINIGDSLPSVRRTVTRTDIVKYAGAGGDFNPLHHDEVFAQSVGLPSVFAMGLLHGGYLTSVLSNWAGPETVRRYKIRFKSPVVPGDTLICEGTVVGKEAHGALVTVQVQLSVKRENGESVIEGDADLAFPSINAAAET